MPDKQITQKAVTASHVDRLTIEVVNGEPTVWATYHVVDAGGKRIGNQRAVAVELPPSAATALKNFVANTVLSAVNAAEGT